MSLLNAIISFIFVIASDSFQYGCIKNAVGTKKMKIKSAPKPVLEKVNKEAATKAKELLESAGGKVTIK